MSPAELIAEMFLKLNKPAQIQMALKAMELLQEQETVAVICTWCEDHPIAGRSLVQELHDEDSETPSGDAVDSISEAYENGFKAGRLFEPDQRPFGAPEPPTEMLDATD